MTNSIKVVLIYATSSWSYFDICLLLTLGDEESLVTESCCFLYPKSKHLLHNTQGTHCGFLFIHGHSERKQLRDVIKNSINTMIVPSFEAIFLTLPCPWERTAYTLTYVVLTGSMHSLYICLRGDSLTNLTFICPLWLFGNHTMTGGYLIYSSKGCLQNELF